MDLSRDNLPTCCLLSDKSGAAVSCQYDFGPFLSFIPSFFFFSILSIPSFFFFFYSFSFPFIFHLPSLFLSFTSFLSLSLPSPCFISFPFFAVLPFPSLLSSFLLSGQSDECVQSGSACSMRPVWLAACGCHCGPPPVRIDTGETERIKDFKRAYLAMSLTAMLLVYVFLLPYHPPTPNPSTPLSLRLSLSLCF